MTGLVTAGPLPLNERSVVAAAARNDVGMGCVTVTFQESCAMEWSLYLPAVVTLKNCIPRMGV